MKRVFFLCVLLSSLAYSAVAQEVKKEEKKEEKKKYWTLKGGSSLNFVQASYSNWSSGGENSISGAANGNLLLKHKKDKISWETGLVLGYGLTFQGSKRSKNEDKIDFSSKLGYRAFKNWDYTAMVSFKSQFDKGYAKYPITPESKFNSKFMSPGYSVISAGMDYKPNENFSLLLSPLSGKMTFVMNDSLSNIGAFGVAKGEHINMEFGAFIKTVYRKKLHENIDFTSSLDFFSNLLETPENIDINWEISVKMKVTKFISANVGTQLVYDDDVKSEKGGPRIQFKQVLGVGFSYSF